MINRIVIADMATYPHAPSMMDGLTKINLVYGANCAGKLRFHIFRVLWKVILIQVQ